MSSRVRQSPLRIEDYALIGDTQSAALVGRNGSVDWLCLPRFDSDACFAALLGTEQHGRWLIAPSGEVRSVARRYRPGTLVLETEFTTGSGVLRVTDCMPPRETTPDVVRIAECVSGTVDVSMELAIRFGYGLVVPWVTRIEGGVEAIAGPDALTLRTPVPLRIANAIVTAEMALHAGDRAAFTLSWHPSFQPAPEPIDAVSAVDDTAAWWRAWSERCPYDGEWREAVVRSLVTLKALTYLPTGGIVAAPTTSLPEALGGVRNWDYRYCWLRDATFTLLALMEAGYTEEAGAWRDWLLRAAAGDPAQFQVMYGAAGERRLTEIELGWLPGYEGSMPVRIGNAAVRQLQLDIYGEVLDCFHQARGAGLPAEGAAWDLQRALLDFLESNWRRCDEGIWEVRGPRRAFTHSKVMAWVAMDRAVRAVEDRNLPGPVERWRALRDEIHEDVCRHGYDASRGHFTQFYGSTDLDASLLRIPLVGFLPAHDPRVEGTVAAVERELMAGGFIRRYLPDPAVDGLPHGEGVFLPCTFWFADVLALLGRREEALRLFERLLSLTNDVGLLSEQYDVERRRLLGNFPQAFTHVSLINTAYNLSLAGGPAARRLRGGEARPPA